jgi:hypothetical protein
MKLENVQVGDTLIWNGRHFADSQVVKVDRLTKTQVVIDDYRYRKSDGRRVGASAWDSTWVSMPKEGEIDKIRMARLHRKLVNSIDDACQVNKLRAMSLEQLKQLNSLLVTL